MNINTENPKIQDSSFNLHEYLAKFATLDACKHYCTGRGIRQEAAPFLFDFAALLKKAEKLFISGYGENWFDTANDFSFYELATKKPVSLRTNKQKGAKQGKGLSPRQVFEAIEQGKNFFWEGSIRRYVYNIGLYPVNLHCLDLDIHGEKEEERKAEAENLKACVEYIESKKIPCFGDVTARGTHIWFKGDPAITKKTEGLTATEKPYKAEYFATYYDGTQYDGLMVHFGANRVEPRNGKTYADMINWIYDGDPVICPSELIPQEEKTADLIPANIAYTADREPAINLDLLSETEKSYFAQKAKDFHEGNRDAGLSKYLFGLAKGFSSTDAGRDKLTTVAAYIWQNLPSQRDFPLETALQKAKGAFKNLGKGDPWECPVRGQRKKSSEKQTAQTAQSEKEPPAVVLAVNALLANANLKNCFYFNVRNEEVYTVKNGFMTCGKPEHIKELRLPYGYSKSDKTRLFSMLRTYLPAEREINSLWDLTAESTCYFKDGTVLSAVDGKPYACKFSEYKGKPFASAIDANFIPELAEYGFQRDYSILEMKAPYFSYYLNSSFDKKESRKRICQMIGSALNPKANTNLPNVWNLIGDPGCGKGTIIDFLRKVFDPEAVAILSALPTKGDRWALSSIAIANKAPTLLLTPDTQSVDVVNPLPFKLIAGGDGLTVESKGRDGKRTGKNLTWIIGSNNKLRWRAERDQMTQKIAEIPYRKVNFRQSQDNRIDLDELLYSEASEILSFCWGVFSRTLLERERFNFEYVEIDLENDVENNPLRRFLRDHCKRDESSKVSAQDVFNAFIDYMEGSGLAEWSERDVLGSMSAKPSKLFNKTFSDWRTSWGVTGNRENCYTVDGRRTKNYLYNMVIDLDADFSKEGISDVESAEWRYKSISCILSESLKAALPAYPSASEQTAEAEELNPPALPAEIRVIHVSENMEFSEAVHYETTYPYTTPEPTDPVMELEETISDPAPAMTAKEVSFVANPLDSEKAKEILCQRIQPGSRKTPVCDIVQTLAKDSITPEQVYSFLNAHGLGKYKDFCYLDPVKFNAELTNA